MVFKMIAVLDSQIEALIKKYGEPKCDVWSFGTLFILNRNHYS